MLKDKIKKQINEIKIQKETQVNLVKPPNPWYGSWDKDNLIEKKKKNSDKPILPCQSHDLGQKTGITSYKSNQNKL